MDSDYRFPVQNWPNATSRRLPSWLSNFADFVSRRATVDIDVPGSQTNVNQACLDLVAFKDEIDRKYSGEVRGNNGYTRPNVFLNFMMPWLYEPSDGQSSNFISVDPNYVLGCSGHRNPAPGDPEKVMRDLNKMPSDHKERARYLKIGHLPLFLAVEGKNRVELFRKYSKEICADVTAVKTLEGIQVVPIGSGQKWAAICKHHCYGATFSGYAIPYPEIVMPIYLACGAEVSATPLQDDQVEKYWRASFDFALSRLRSG